MTAPKHFPGYVPNPSYTQADWDAVCDNPELTDEELAGFRPFREVFPELHANMQRRRPAVDVFSHYKPTTVEAAPEGSCVLVRQPSNGRDDEDQFQAHTALVVPFGGSKGLAIISPGEGMFTGLTAANASVWLIDGAYVMPVGVPRVSGGGHLPSGVIVQRRDGFSLVVKLDARHLMHFDVKTGQAITPKIEPVVWFPAWMLMAPGPDGKPVRLQDIEVQV